MDKLGPLFDRIAKKYNVRVRTATQVRKSFTTRVARECMEAERRAVAKQLSTSVETSSRHYENTNTRKGAADVAKLLVKKKKPEKQNRSEKQSRRNYSEDEKVAIDDFLKTQIEKTGTLASNCAGTSSSYDRPSA